jgi:urease alpha subunit
MITATTIMMLPMGCANASEPTFDSDNPVSCLAIFGATANSAKQASNATRAVAVADDMAKRIIFLAEQHGGVEWLKKVTPEAMRIGAKMEAANDGSAAIKFFDECVAKQNADPAFRSRVSKR